MLLYELFSSKLFLTLKTFIIACTNVVFPPLSLSLFVSELDMSAARLSQEPSSSEDSILIISLL